MLSHENHKITKAATTIGMGTLLSRILGFFRDMVIAHFFGAGMAADAFFVAFRIPNLWRRLVGEGSLTISFIPVYTEYLTQRSEEESREVDPYRLYHCWSHLIYPDASWGLSSRRF